MILYIGIATTIWCILLAASCRFVKLHLTVILAFAIIALLWPLIAIGGIVAIVLYVINVRLKKIDGERYGEADEAKHTAQGTQGYKW